jgi:prevent-host-death family protein
MIKVSISRLKDQLSSYLKKVEAGQTVIVTDRNKPVAQLTPMPRSENESERIERLIDMGVLTRAKEPPLSIQEIRRMRPVAPGARLLEALLEERESGW